MESGLYAQYTAVKAGFKIPLNDLTCTQRASHVTWLYGLSSARGRYTSSDPSGLICISSISSQIWIERVKKLKWEKPYNTMDWSEPVTPALPLNTAPITVKFFFFNLNDYSSSTTLTIRNIIIHLPATSMLPVHRHSGYVTDESQFKILPISNKHVNTCGAQPSE
jgi:hypothetical protein